LNGGADNIMNVVPYVDENLLSIHTYSAQNVYQWDLKDGETLLLATDTSQSSPLADEPQDCSFYKWAFKSVATWYAPDDGDVTIVLINSKGWDQQVRYVRRVLSKDNNATLSPPSPPLLAYSLTDRIPMRSTRHIVHAATALVVVGVTMPISVIIAIVDKRRRDNTLCREPASSTFKIIHGSINFAGILALLGSVIALATVPNESTSSLRRLHVIVGSLAFIMTLIIIVTRTVKVAKYYHVFVGRLMLSLFAFNVLIGVRLYGDDNVRILGVIVTFALLIVLMIGAVSKVY